MKSRRRIAFPRGQDHADCDCVQLQQEFATGEMGVTIYLRCKNREPPDVRFGSKADISAYPRHVRFAPNSGH
jgi:hypothetical protein